MANTVIQLKYSDSASVRIPPSLAVGEAAYSSTAETLYIGLTGGGIANIGGLLYTQTIDNATSAATINTLVKRDGSNQVAATTFTGALVGNASTATTAAAWTTGRTISITGDIGYTSASLTGAGDVTGTATLPTVNSNVGDYTKITINAKGQATAGATASISDLSAPTGDVAFGANKITGLATPTAGTDAANKTYVDSIVQGLDPKASVRVATTANITLSGTQTIDTIAVTAGQRVLVKNQSTAADNGIYVVAAGSWARSDDTDTYAKLVSAYLFVEEGATLADTSFTCTIDTGGTLGVTAITFVQFSGAGSYAAGTGLTLTGTSFSITNTAISAGTFGSASAVPVVAVNAQGQITGATDTNIAIAASQVNSGTLPIARGGTNQTSFTAGITYFDGTSLATLTSPTYSLTGTLGATKTITSLTVDSYGRTTAATAADIAIAASQVTSGSFSVGVGGTGRTTLTSNAVLYGLGTSAVGLAASSTEGHLLTINASGVPTFAMLTGGTF
jgi:hypothetical protein